MSLVMSYAISERNSGLISESYASERCMLSLHIRTTTKQIIHVYEDSINHTCNFFLVFHACNCKEYRQNLDMFVMHSSSSFELADRTDRYGDLSHGNDGRPRNFNINFISKFYTVTVVLGRQTAKRGRLLRALDLYV